MPIPLPSDGHAAVFILVVPECLPFEQARLAQPKAMAALDLILLDIESVSANDQQAPIPTAMRADGILDPVTLDAPMLRMHHVKLHLIAQISPGSFFFRRCRTNHDYLLVLRLIISCIGIHLLDRALCIHHSFADTPCLPPATDASPCPDLQPFGRVLRLPEHFP